MFEKACKETRIPRSILVYDLFAIQTEIPILNLTIVKFQWQMNHGPGNVELLQACKNFSSQFLV